MDEKMVKQEEGIEIDLGRLFRALLHKAWLLILVSVTAATLALVFTVAFMTPQYEASATFYVNNGSLSNNQQGSMSSGDIAASRGLVETYIEILKTRETLQQVVDYTGLELGYKDLANMISASAVGDTEIFKVVVTHPDPVEAEELARAITKVFPARITAIIKNTTVQVVDTPVVPTAPVSPSKTTNTILGFLIGFVLAAGIVVLQQLLDVTVRSEEDIARICSYSILTAVPDMQAPTKNHYYYDTSKKRQTVENTAEFGPNIGFAAAEAYKLLRTKLQYSFADEKDCYVVGVSSAESGEGKSLTAINLTYSLAQLGKRVMLIDCDMRRPTISAKMSISRFPGLSGYLVKQSNLDEVIHTYTQPGDEVNFHVITAGQTPPIPVELLSSARMGRLLDKLRLDYDYVILDLPPVGEVSDALAVTGLMDGVLLVVRQNYCDRRLLESTVRQFEFVNGRILGLVYNGVEEDGKGVKYKRYKKNPYYRGGGKLERNSGGRYAAKPAQKQETK